MEAADQPEGPRHSPWAWSPHSGGERRITKITKLIEITARRPVSGVRRRLVSRRGHTDDLRPPNIRSTKETFGGH